MRRFLVFFATFLFTTSILFVIAYAKMGLREHLGVLRQISKISDVSIRSDAKNTYFNGIRNDSIGGTLAWIGNDYVLLWGKYFVTRISAKRVRAFTFPDCGMEKGRMGEIDHTSINEWGGDVKVGEQVYVQKNAVEVDAVFSIYKIYWRAEGEAPIFCQVRT